MYTNEESIAYKHFKLGSAVGYSITDILFIFKIFLKVTVLKKSLKLNLISTSQVSRY